MTEDNVYNPKKDLYPSPQAPSRRSDAQDFYDPSDEVQDLYRSEGTDRSRQHEERPNVYNPRQELGQFQGSGPWGNSGNHGGYGGGVNANEAPGPMPRPVSKDPRANRRDPRRRD